MSKFPQASGLPTNWRPFSLLRLYYIAVVNKAPVMLWDQNISQPISVPISPSPNVPISGPQLPPTSPHPSPWDRPYRPPPHSTASWARSPARLGPFSIQHELAEATPKGAAREQHRTQLHDQLQHPASRANLRSHLGKGQSATASPGSGRLGRRLIQVTSGPLLFFSSSGNKALAL